MEHEEGEKENERKKTIGDAVQKLKRKNIQNTRKKREREQKNQEKK